MRLWAGMLWMGLVVLPAGADAAGLIRGRVELKGLPKGASSGQSVVYVVGFDEPPPSQVVRLAQSKKAFIPDVLAVTRGQQVEFMNSDTLSHNVFSVSAAGNFDTGITPPGDNPTVKLARLGLVDVYCNIHPEMVATILVLPNRAFAVTKSDGGYEIPSLPEGEFTIYAWNRFAKPEHRKVVVRGGQALELDWQLAAEYAAAPHLNKYGRAYRDPGKY